ncbi:MAG TPA: hypothetical protein EYP86_05035 [Candidatus Altiarchaeales archaeon]|nr:hypothetical protein [Candidatus Altiarchaeales archaeon]
MTVNLTFWDSSNSLLMNRTKYFSVNPGTSNTTEFNITIPLEWENEVRVVVELMNLTVSKWTEYLYTYPYVELKYPPDNSYLNSGTDIWFNLTVVSDTDLVNATLWGNFSGTWVENQTIPVTNNTEMGVRLNLSDGTYVWNYLVFDNSSHSNWADYNFTVIIDTTFPFYEMLQNLQTPLR